MRPEMMIGMETGMEIGKYRSRVLFISKSEKRPRTMVT